MISRKDNLISNDYDLRHLIAASLLSQTYSRSSRWTSQSPPPAAQSFAIASSRALTPRQLGASLLIACRSAESWPTVEQTRQQPEDWLKRRTDLENQANGWMREFEQPGEDFQIAVDEALFFSNNQRVQTDLLRDGGDRITGILKAAETPQLMARQLWRIVYSRDPDDEELQAATNWLTGADEQQLPRIQSLVWAVLAGTEFRFNH